MSLSDTSPSTVSREERYARDREDPASANPYPAGSDEHAIWRRAYETPDDESNAVEAEEG